MSFTTFKTEVNNEITSKHLIPGTVNALIIGDKFTDLADEVIAAFTALNGGTPPTDYDTIFKIGTRIVAINAHIGASGKTIDQLIADINAKDAGTVVDSKISTAINALIGGAPGALNALNELATAIGNDPNFATTITNSIAQKEPSFAKNTAFNKNFGSVAGTVAEGNHTHSSTNITEGTNLFFTNARAIAATLTAYTKAGTVTAITAATTILQAIGLLDKRQDNLETSLGQKANLVDGKVPLVEIPTIPLSQMEEDDLINHLDTEQFEEVGVDYVRVKDFILDPNILNKDGYWLPTGENTAISLTATQAFAVGGTATSSPVASTNFFTSLKKLMFVGAATATAAATVRGAVLSYFRGAIAGIGGFKQILRFGCGDLAAITDPKCFYGMRASIGAIVASQDVLTLTNVIGVGNKAGDANLSVIHNDASGNITEIALGASFPAHVLATDANPPVYRLEVTAKSGIDSVTVKITNETTGVSATHVLTTNLPAQSEMLASAMYRSNNATAASAIIAFFGQKITMGV